jgi:hypothetical protein
VFGQLGGKAAEALGRAYALAGLLPALLVVGGLWWVLNGSDAVTSLFADVSKGDGKTLTLFGALLILASVGFTVGRESVVAFFERLPGKALVPLRSRMTNRALAERQAIAREITLREAEYTALSWLPGAGHPADNTQWYVSAAVPQTPWPEVKSLSAHARTVADDVAARALESEVSMSLAEVNDIVRGILALYAHVARFPAATEHAQEIAAWSTWQSARAERSKILLRAREHVQRELAEPTTRKRSFPEGLWIMPTRIGNMFSALDDYAQKRYGVPTYLLWQRIWWVLPENDRKEIGEARIIVEGLLCMAVASAIVAAGALLLAACRLLACWPKCLDGPAFLIALAGLGGFALLFVIFYRLAIAAARALVDKVTSLTDLHRLPLLKALWIAPGTPRQELEYFSELKAFWIHGLPRGAWRKYSPGESPAKKSS